MYIYRIPASLIHQFGFKATLFPPLSLQPTYECTACLHDIFQFPLELNLDLEFTLGPLLGFLISYLEILSYCPFFKMFTKGSLPPVFTLNSIIFYSRPLLSHV